MANSIGPTGVTTDSQATLLAYYTATFQAIYGASIVLTPDSPDGQWMNILIQATLDLQDFVTNVNAYFDPDQAQGVILDQRVAINGIQRMGGTFTTTDVSITVNQALNLYGLDQSAQSIYTVADSSGNQWELVNSINIASPGTYSLLFQAANPGAVLTVPNTITIPVTIVLGVTNINNPNSYLTLGIAEETDYALRIRRQQSTAIAGQGYQASLLAALLNINGVTSAFVYENTTGTTDANGVPGHSIWVIVAGSGSPGAIANAIYTKRNAGAGMKGSQSFPITLPGGNVIDILWDDVESETLFIKFTATSLNGTTPPNIAAIRSGLPSSFVPGVYGQVNINALAAAVQAIDPNTLVTGGGFSTSSGGTYTTTLTPSALNMQFSVTSPDIIILPIILNPTSDTVAPSATIQFSALGGYGTYTYSIATNVSGGSINSSSGLYTAGTSSSGTDVVRVTDALGNFTNVNVVVT
jgi:hypothetical protein